MNEFDLIAKYFAWNAYIGDDCGVFDPSENTQLVASVDTFIAGVHFPQNTSAADIAYKALAVNLSDLAAMGAVPKYFTLALAMPEIDEVWLGEFSAALKALATEFNIDLIGGDTTCSALSITINVIGEVKKSQALLRSAAQVGDLIFVSGTLGDAGLAWRQIENGEKPSKPCLNKLNRPTPRINLGQKLVGIANSCIDISDGLEQDLGHILKASKVGASVDLAKIPLTAELQKYVAKSADWCLPLAAGDDYELCFSVPAEKLAEMQKLQLNSKIQLTQIGVIDNSLKLSRIGSFYGICKSYQHF